MNIESFRDYCLSKKSVSESFPFNDTALVFKVLDKMFALTSLDKDFQISLKCDPDRLIKLKEEHESIKSAYHFNKKYWLSVLVDGSLSDSFIKDLIDHSYEEVVSKLTKKQQTELLSM